jgi:aminoglycoside phosphotransferase (APT) family kinase protein
VASVRDASDADVLAGLGEALAAGGRPRRRLFLTEPPVLHARSTIYFVGDAEERSLAPQWVVKRPDDRAEQEDLANPLDALRQFEALRRLSGHFEAADPRIRVVRPVAFLPTVGAFAMEYARGPSLDRLVRPRSVVDPNALMAGIRLSARFLRVLHAVEPATAGIVRPRSVAQDLLALARDTLVPASLALPPEAIAALEAVAEIEAPTALVRLHGDFAPVNMILTGAGEVTGIDVSLDAAGTAEEDLARFLMMLMTEQLFLIDVVPVRALRRRAEAVLLESYFGHTRTSVMLELLVMRQLCLRWLRRHVTRIANRPSMSRARTEVVDRYFRALLRERARALHAADFAVIPSGPDAIGMPS